MILRIFFWGIRVGIIILTMAIVWFLGLLLFTQRIPMGPQDLATKTDGIVIFTGGSARLKEGFLLLEEGFAPRLLISGVHPDATLADLKRAARITGKFSSRQVTLGFHAEDTIENADDAAQWALSHHMISLRLVTSNYHMPRSLLELHQKIPNILIIPHPVARAQFRKEKWWLDRKTMIEVLKEYNKYLFALARYPINAIEKLYIGTK